jgi:hypothetical protein
MARTGKMFLVDMNEGRLEDDEIKNAIVTKSLQKMVK